MRIDCHAHYFPGKYLDLIASLKTNEIETSMGRRGAFDTHAEDAAPRLEAMDRAGVEMQILSIATSGPYLQNEADAAKCAYFVNDSYAEMVQLHPDRFRAFAALPLPHVDAAIKELNRAFDQLGFAGAGVATKMGGKSLADPSFDPLYAELDRRNGILFVHPIGHSCDSPLLEQTQLTWPLGAPFEDTAAALQLIQTGFLQKFPNVRVIMPHLGGTLPFLVHRLDHQRERFMQSDIETLPSELVKSFWYDSVSSHAPALRCAIDTFGIDKIVFGTDYPFWKGDAHQHASEYLEHSGLTDAQVAAISDGNARDLFGDLLIN